MTKVVSVVLLFHPKDEDVREKLSNHLFYLQSNGKAELWDQSKIQPGKDSSGVMEEKINKADIFLCLVSSDLMADENINKHQIEPATHKADADAGHCFFVPVIARAYYIEGTALAKYMPLPRDGKPLIDRDWSNTDSPFKDIAIEVEKMVERIAQVADSEGSQDEYLLNPNFQSIEDHLLQNRHFSKMENLHSPKNMGKPLTYLFLLEEFQVLKRLRTTLFEVKYNFYEDSIEYVGSIKDRVKAVREIFEASSIVMSDMIESCTALEEMCDQVKLDLIKPENISNNRQSYLRARYIIPFCGKIEEFERKLHSIAQLSINYSKN
jgi:hypothetical protein